MPRNICLAFGRFGSLFLLTSSVSADGVVCLVILSGCYSSSSLAIPMASTVQGKHVNVGVTQRSYTRVHGQFIAPVRTLTSHQSPITDSVDYRPFTSAAPISPKAPHGRG